MLVSSYANPLSYCMSIAGSNQTSGFLAGIWYTVNFNTDVSTFLNGFIDRPTAPRFRALRAGYYKIELNLVAFTSTADRGYQCRVLKNGSQINSTLVINSSKNTGANRGSSTLPIYLVDLCAVNDYYEVQVNPVDGSTVNVRDITSLNFQLVRLT